MCSVYGNSSSLAGVILCLDLELKMSLALSRNTLSWHFLCAPAVSVLAALTLQSCSEPSTYGLAQVTSMSLTQAAGPEAPVLTTSGCLPVSVKADPESQKASEVRGICW